MEAKLADFGISRIKEDEVSTIITNSLDGSPNWIAPELEFDKPRRYNEKTDTYSFGVVLWEMATRKRPFEDSTTKWETLDKLKNDRQGEREKLPSDTPLAIKTTITWCWNQQRDKRPTAMEALKTLCQPVNTENLNKCDVM